MKLFNLETKKRLQHISKRFKESQIPVYAGQTAFFMMLSFLPFLLFFFTLLNLTPLSEEDFFMFASSLIPASFQEFLYDFSHEIYTGNTGGRIYVTVFTAVYLSSKAFWSIQKGLNAMFQVQETRNQLLLRAYSVVYSIVFAVFLLAVLAIVVLGNWITNVVFVHAPAMGNVFDGILHFRTWICVPLLFLFFWILYVLVPDRKSRWRHRWRRQIPGAAFSSVGWMGFSYAFSIYVDRFSNYASFYGAMTGIALLMLWLYGCMYVLFLGGFINDILPEVRQLLRSCYKK